MRKLICSALMILCLGLTACGGTEQQMRSFADRFGAASQLHLTAQVQSLVGDTVEEYTLEYGYDGSKWTAAVLAPQVLAGITAAMEEDGSKLEYDGVILAAGNLLTMGVSPVAAVPFVHEAVKKGCLDCVWQEDDLLAGNFQYNDGVSVSLRFDAAGIPVAAELTENGIVQLQCRFTNVKIEDGGNETTDETNLGGN
jgi:hypothetical protein